MEFDAEATANPWNLYESAVALAVAGDIQCAREGLMELRAIVTEPRLLAHIENDLGVLAAQAGETKAASGSFSRALGYRPEWEVANKNLYSLNPRKRDVDVTAMSQRTRVAIVSLLFNWPSTGGGTVHTAEAARFLTQAGYDVRHISVRYDPWGLGQICEPTDWPLQELAFTEWEWSRTEIERRVRAAVDEFHPDAVIVTDSWSMKPRLAEALSGYRVYLRLAAQECLCPLNNVRLLSLRPRPVSCPRQQLATPQTCRDCVAARGQFSGTLHQLERELAGFGDEDYAESVRRAFANVAGVLVVNPLIAEMVKPFAQAVHVIPSGFDAQRFPWTEYDDAPGETDRPTTLLFAGLVDEPMKGFEILKEECRILRREELTFRLVVTSEPIAIDHDGSTIAEEALGRTAVEAMGAWRPVVASRLGGLPFTVLDEATGLLCEPGDPEDLAPQLARLIDNSELRRRLGTLGRRRFEENYVWDVILNRYYRPLLGGKVVSG